MLTGHLKEMEMYWRGMTGTTPHMHLSPHGVYLMFKVMPDGKQTNTLQIQVVCGASAIAENHFLIFFLTEEISWFLCDCKLKTLSPSMENILRVFWSLHTWKEWIFLFMWIQFSLFRVDLAWVMCWSNLGLYMCTETLHLNKTVDIFHSSVIFVLHESLLQL